MVAADIVFDYRQKATRTFEYLQGDYYIAPLFLVSLPLGISSWTKEAVLFMCFVY